MENIPLPPSPVPAPPVILPTGPSRTPVTVSNIIFGLGILICPILLFGAMFADTKEGVPIAEVAMRIAVYYPIVTIISIIVSQIKKSFAWALVPGYALIVFFVFGVIAPAAFFYPVEILWGILFKS